MKGPLLLLSEHFPERVGGTSAYAMAAVKALEERGVSGKLITYAYGSPPIKSETIVIDRLRIPVRLRLERYFPFLAVLPGFRYILDERPRAIHVLHGFFAAFLGAFLGKFFRIPAAISVQNLARNESGHVDRQTRGEGYMRLVRALDWAVCRLPVPIVVPSSHVAEEVRRVAPSARVAIIPYGLDTGSYLESASTAQENSTQLRFLCVGGFIHHKGQDVLIEALAKLKTEGVDFRCTVIGPVKDWSYRDYCERLIKVLQLESDISLLPTKRGRALQEQFIIADIYVQPSREEGFCLTVLEAMLYGKPVIGTQTGAIPEMLEGGHGLVVPTESPKALADAMLLLSQNPKLRTEMGHRARERCLTEFGIDRLGERLLEFYRELTTNQLCQK